MSYLDIRELFNDAKDIASGSNNLQLKNTLLEIQTRMYELLDENRELRLKLEEKTNNHNISNELVFETNVYFYKEEGPYCSNCWDTNNKLIRIIPSPKGMQQRLGTHYCPQCKNLVNLTITE